MDNVLLQLDLEPKFDQLDVKQIKPALEVAMQHAKNKIKIIKNTEAVTWQNTVEVLTDEVEKVGRIWGVVAHIHSVADSPEWRDAYNEMMPTITQFFTEISQDITLYKRFKAIHAADEFKQLNQAQQKKLNNDLRDFVLSGAELPQEKQKILADLHTRSAQLSASFSQNVLDATDAFSLYFEDDKDLQGIPESALNMFLQAAQAEGKSGYKIGLQIPHYLAVMQHADNRELRKTIYFAYISRASELGQGQWDNTENINQILTVAYEEAKLLGYENYASLSLVTKMADTPQNVVQFLRDLATKAKPFAQQDIEQLKIFAQEYLKIEELQAWDIAYASEKLRQEQYEFSEEEVKQYFPVTKVLQGLFRLIYDLYGITFQESSRAVWHPDVKYYELIRQNTLIGGVYIDMYARQGKRSGAWMNDYCGRRQKLLGELQLPIAYLVCNFTPPHDGEAYLSHQEVITLFHETGHGLHHLLTRIDELGVSGINGVEWDAVELPSQFMENFAWEYDVLQGLTEHKISREALPKSLYDKMLAAKNFQTGLFVVRQIEFGLFDMLIYQQTQQPCDWKGILKEVRKEVSVVPLVTENRFANSFSHIFAGGYSAGYYSYIWAEVLSADVYVAFEESQDRKKTGQKFLQEILSVGGSRSALESFIAFRGRKPSGDALLKHLGLSI